MTTDEIIAATIIENSDTIAAGEMSGFDLFDAVYGPMPIRLENGEWCVVSPDHFATGVTAGEVAELDEPATLDDLCSALNLSPWSLAADYGWDETELDADACDSPAAIDALSQSRRELAEYERQERDRIESELDDAEQMEAEERACRAAERGERLEFFSGETLDDAANELGMPDDSETARLYYERKLDRSEAMRRAAKIIHRHTMTDYDDLLSRGIDRETAREIATGE